MKIKLKTLALLCIYGFTIYSTNCQNTLTATYNSGDIPTTLFSYDDSCNGLAATISVTLPPGDRYGVLSTQVSYSMTASGAGFMADQRSKLICISTGVSEVEAIGVGNSNGTMLYNRSTNMANDFYPGGSTITFGIYAKREYDDGAGNCSTTTNKINNGTLTIIVHYTDEIVIPKVGVNTPTPEQSLHVNGKIKLGNDDVSPVAGTMRFNPSTDDFEGYDGTKWISFTRSSNGQPTWGNQSVHENNKFSGSSGSEAKYGKSLSVRAYHAAIGIPGYYNPLTSQYPGGVKMLRKIANEWLDYTNIVAPDQASNAEFGYSVAVNGNYMVIGSPGYTVGGQARQGKAYVYEFIASTWVHLQTIVAPDGMANDEFGTQVAVNSEYIVISAPNKDIGSTSNAGKVYVYQQFLNTWNLHASLTAFDPEESALFGSEINLSEFYIMVGAPLKNEAGVFGLTNNVGKVYIYKRTMEDFNFETSLLDPNPILNDNFGSSIAFDGNDLFISTPNKGNGIYFNHGIVNRYRKEDNVWTFQNEILPKNRTNQLRYGIDLAVHEGILVIGSNKSFGNNTEQGAVDLFKLEDDGWCFKTELTATDGASSNNFGSAVSVYSGDIFVGSPYSDLFGYNNNGDVYFFKKN
ncbi:MAG: hypothetical protein RLZZ546_918 [Bacteroidota bacterium]|jgi:hypothetical protein